MVGARGGPERLGNGAGELAACYFGKEFFGAIFSALFAWNPPPPPSTPFVPDRDGGSRAFWGGPSVSSLVQPGQGSWSSLRPGNRVLFFQGGLLDSLGPGFMRAPHENVPHLPPRTLQWRFFFPEKGPAMNGPGGDNKKNAGPERESSPSPGGEGLPSVPGGWVTIYAAPNRLAAIRIQGLMEALGFQVWVLEEALGLSSPFSNPLVPQSFPYLPDQDPSDSHLVVPALQAEAARAALETVLREIEKFEKERGH